METEVKMKLSQAIREGAKLAPQIHGDVCHSIKLKTGEVVKGTDALGAAYHAVTGELPPSAIVKWGISRSPEAVRQMMKTLGFDTDPQIPSTTSYTGKQALSVAIIEANDVKWQTREQIADWLESIGY